MYFFRVFIFSVLFTLAQSTFASLTSLELVGLAIFNFNAIFFISALGKRIDVSAIILLISSSQWILGPIIAYHGYDPYFRYTMHVESEQYFDFVIPAFTVFELGILLLWKRSVYDSLESFNRMIEWMKLNPQLIYTLIAVGFLATLGIGFIPSSLRFVAFLLSACLQVGVILYFLADLKFKWFAIGFLTVMLLLQSINTGLFHNMILWFLFIFMFLSFSLRTSLGVNIMVVVAGLFSLVIVQSIKGTYRSLVWENGQKDGKAGVFLTLVEEQATSAEDLTTGERISELNVRLNQGWIISRIMMNIPQYNEPLQGQTFSEALSASLLPRFLNPSKRKGGSVYTFELLTGLNIDENTSMGPSLLGEAYGNYLREGGIVAMFIIGLCMGFSIFIVMNMSNSYPILFGFIPIVFFQVVKAETDSITVLNHLVKSLILFIPLSIYLTNRYLKMA